MSPDSPAPEEVARAAVEQAAVDLVVAIDQLRLAHPAGLGLVDPAPPSNPGRDMRLARAFLVQIATARPGQGCVPDGFTPTWGGKAAVQILALDRDRLAVPIKPLDLVELLVHPGPGEPHGWRTGP